VQDGFFMLDEGMRNGSVILDFQLDIEAIAARSAADLSLALSLANQRLLGDRSICRTVRGTNWPAVGGGRRGGMVGVA